MSHFTLVFFFYSNLFGLVDQDPVSLAIDNHDAIIYYILIFK